MSTGDRLSDELLSDKYYFPRLQPPVFIKAMNHLALAHGILANRPRLPAKQHSALSPSLPHFTDTDTADTHVIATVLAL